MSDRQAKTFPQPVGRSAASAAGAAGGLRWAQRRQRRRLAVAPICIYFSPSAAGAAGAAGWLRWAQRGQRRRLAGCVGRSVGSGGGWLPMGDEAPAERQRVGIVGSGGGWGLASVAGAGCIWLRGGGLAAHCRRRRRAALMHCVGNVGGGMAAGAVRRRVWCRAVGGVGCSRSVLGAGAGRAGAAPAWRGRTVFWARLRRH